jgi:acetoin utilization deacetylase AcuC-like enzyme
MTTALITHPVCLKHEMGAHHPECPERLQSVYEALSAEGLLARMQKIEAPEATREQLAAAHDGDYVDHIFSAAPKTDYAYLDPDTAMNPFSLEAARRASGAVIRGVDMVMNGELGERGNAFCAVRPCGHHATHDRAMGFCIFNNVAVGALHAINHYKLERVAILDFDVHHGNGTEDIFHDDERVMLCSSFQHPYYPGTGANSGNAHIIPTPLAARTTGAEFRRALDATWWPALNKFKPELILISAGFDAHADDPLAYLQLREDDYVWVTERIREVANQHAEGRIVSVLEGGYNLAALGRSAAAHVTVLLQNL